MLSAVPCLPLAEGPLGISNSQWALLISGAAIIYVIQRWRRNTLNKLRLNNQSPPANDGRSMHAFTGEITALLGEVEETARRLTAQIDNRYRRLEQLVAEADEKISRLEALTNATASEPKAPLQKPEPAVTESQRVLARLRHERGAPPASQDPAYQPIYSLADGGKSARDIAQQLGRQPGEVELILALRQR